MLRIITCLALASPSLAAPLLQRADDPSVTIRNGTVVGKEEDDVESFLGIPFAQAPTGDLRLRSPQTLTTGFPDGTFYAQTAAAACPQFLSQLDNVDDLGADVLGELFSSPLLQEALDVSEDCLTISVQRPAGTTSEAKLPVLFWVYGGGFELGWSSMYDGTNVVHSSMGMEREIIFVAVNYRVNGFGFLAGRELAAERSTNLGLRDQRKGLEWVAENIAAFGGDPEKVTLWGESAGAISICDQTTINGGDNTYNGKPLFQGIVANSGSVIPATDVTSPKAQNVYDTVVNNSPCAGVADSLSCLRGLEYEDFYRAVSSLPGLFSHRSIDIAYLPRPDSGDNFFAKSPEVSIEAGEFAKVPVIVGDQEDEGTLFSLVQNNITTNDELIDYLASYFPANEDALADATELAAQYADEVLLGQPEGSPFRTGNDNNIYPQFKRLAAILGDLTFTLTRRGYLDSITKQGVTAYSYLATYAHGTPVLGTLHASDLIYSFFTPSGETLQTRSAHTYYINFVHDQDPNSAGLNDEVIEWPAWSNETVQLLQFDHESNGYITDDFRAGAYNVLKPKVSKFRI